MVVPFKMLFERHVDVGDIDNVRAVWKGTIMSKLYQQLTSTIALKLPNLSNAFDLSMIFPTFPYISAS